MKASSRLAQACFLRSAPLRHEWKVGASPKNTASAGQGLPKHILLLRHGESMGNVDENLFTIMPDWRIPLSAKGKEQARQAGHKIQAMLPAGTPLVVYVSPYVRTKETLAEVQSVLRDHPTLFTREEPRLREQDFGNFQDYDKIQYQKAERPQFGRFFYRFNNGESGADVFDRVSAFLGTFVRDMQQVQAEMPNVDMDHTAALFVTHGITARLFLMRWLHWSVDEFEELHNPPNTGLLHLERDGSIYRLSTESTALIKAPRDSGGALQLGFQLEKRPRESSDRAAFAALVDSARGT